MGDNPKFKDIKKAGVIYVMERAAELGFKYTDPSWINLGQGAPETGQIGDSPLRLDSLNLEQKVRSYAPVAGVKELREKVAELYNQLFRQNKSQYSFKNVSIAPGGRSAITRSIAILDDVNFGYFLPDYASYEGIINIFREKNTFPIYFDSKNNFEFDLESAMATIEKYNINAILMSNPTNPTGNVVEKAKLKKFVEYAKIKDIILIFDEFYFNYIFDNGDNFLSSAEFIENIESENVIIISGITKACRYPGWRIGWIIGPQRLIEKITAVGSFLEGGANHPLQNAAIDLLDIDTFKKESLAIKNHFQQKRSYLCKSLQDLGFILDCKANGGFYVWAGLDNFPSLNKGMVFFEKCLEEKVIVVPGEFFDLNPENEIRSYRFENYVRFSFGPTMDILEEGVKRLGKIVYS